MFKYENDSRKVQKGQTFIAIKGLTVDGHDYIDMAVNNGASEIICEKDINVNIPYKKVEDTTEYEKELLSNEYKKVIDKLKLVGVTGTNGKTTSCYLMYQMLCNCGIKAAYIGTIGYFRKGYHIDLPNTTPDILTVYKLLVDAYENKCKVVVMEVSSQALSYDRLHGINYDVIGFTNLTEDHLDYHKTMENYLNAKLMILDHLKDNAKIIVNSDDENSKYFMKDEHEIISIGTKGNYKINTYDIDPAETKLLFEYEGVEHKVVIPLTSKFNIYNYLTMMAIIKECGIDLEKILEKTIKLKAPKGRCETYKSKKGFAVVDYAHTPDAVEKVINSYREFSDSSIITIIGCGGDRDPKKRPIMGKLATELSSYVIFTNDNPRTENEEDIMNDILSGVKKDNYEVIFDRREAIKHGLDMLEDKDILLVLGKGHENYQIIGKEKFHLDDTEEILNYDK